MRVCELFSGIGAQHAALDAAGIEAEYVCSEIDEQAHRAYCAIHGDTPNLGDITKVERLPDCDILTWSFPCLRGDQRVHTRNGLTPIKDVKVGDEVLTHMGRYKTVTAHAMTGIHGTVKIHTPISDLYCTKDHMIYTRFKIRPNGHKDDDGIVRRKFTPAYWAPAISLQGENYVGYVVNPNEIPLEWEGADVKGSHGSPTRRTKLREHLNNEDFWWVCGRYVADGWTFHSETQSARVTIAIGKGKESDIEKIRKVFHTSLAKERTVTKCHICNTEFMEFVIKYFGHGASNKFIHQDILDLPVHLLRAFMEGYLSGDGHFHEEGQEWSCNSVSERLIRDLQQAIMKVYHAAPKYNFFKRPETTVIEGRTVHQKDTHSLKWHTEARKQDKMFYEDGIIWAPVKGVESLNPTQVYDISVEDDNSFVCEGMIVHNCQDLSIASGYQKGFEEGSGTRSSLAWEVIRLLRKAKEDGNLPEFLLMENVYAILNKRNIKEFTRLVGELDKIGYTSTYEVLNAKDYGVPQSRKRCFMVSSLDGAFVFPGPCPDGRVLGDVLEPPEDVPERYYLSESRLEGLMRSTGKQADKGNGFRFKPKGSEDTAFTVTTHAGSRKTDNFVCVQTATLAGKGHDCIKRIYSPTGMSPTVTTACGGGHIPKIELDGLRFRKLTPRECWRLQGFSDEAFDRARALGLSDTVMYRLAGNSIAVPCLTAILRGIYGTGGRTAPGGSGRQATLDGYGGCRVPGPIA